MTTAAALASVLPVTFSVQPSGRVQLARTGSGFWRRDHGAPFAITRELLEQLLENTRKRRRPIRVDIMHWANGDTGDRVEQLIKAAELEPAWITLEPWTEPATGEAGWGLFSPAAWTGEGWGAVQAGIDETSPVIDWAFVLPESVPGIPAGTLLGPTITGLSLVDRGFFWMDKVRLYHANGAADVAASYLYQEFAMNLSPEQLKALIEAMAAAGLDEEAQKYILSACMGGGAAAAAPVETPAAEPAATTPAAEMEKKQPYRALSIPGASKPAPPKPAAPALTLARTPEATDAAGAPAKPPTPLGQLMAALTAPRPAALPPAPQAPTGEQGYAELKTDVAALRDQVSELTEACRGLIVRELDREGRLAGVQDPLRLMKEAPGYFSELIAGKPALIGQQAPGAPKGPAPLARVAAEAQGDAAAFASRVSAYREAQAKTGRRITQAQAIAEVEEQDKQKAAAR